MTSHVELPGYKRGKNLNSGSFTPEIHIGQQITMDSVKISSHALDDEEEIVCDGIKKPIFYTKSTEVQTDTNKRKDESLPEKGEPLPTAITQADDDVTKKTPPRDEAMVFKVPMAPRKKMRFSRLVARKVKIQ